jgi:hypothetical protein
MAAKRKGEKPKSTTTANIPAYRFDTGMAICKLDRIIAAVGIAHDQIQPVAMRANSGISDAWLTLELAQEKLGDLRKELEDAEVAHG